MIIQGLPWFLRSFFPCSMPGKIVQKLREKEGSVLDVGCGTGALFASLRLKRSITVGVDIFQPDLIKATRYGAYSDLVIADVRFLPFKRKSFENVLCSEVIEHLPKEEGHKLVTSLETIAKRFVVLTTPVGFYPQKASPDNPYQAHISGWASSEMKELGFEVVRVGFREAGIVFGKLPIPARILAENVVYPLTELLVAPFLDYCPSLARDMVCTKSL